MGSSLSHIIRPTFPRSPEKTQGARLHVMHADTTVSKYIIQQTKLCMGRAAASSRISLEQWILKNLRLARVALAPCLPAIGHLPTGFDIRVRVVVSASSTCCCGHKHTHSKVRREKMGYTYKKGKVKRECCCGGGTQEFWLGPLFRGTFAMLRLTKPFRVKVRK